jgi:hypothetical protein
MSESAPVHRYYHCPACGLHAWLEPSDSEGIQSVHCSGCGSYCAAPSFLSLQIWRKYDAGKIANITGYIRENQGLTLTADDLDFLLRIPTPTLEEKAGKMLRFLAKLEPMPGESIFELSLWSIDAQLAQSRGIQEEPFAPDPAAEEACAKVAPFLSHSWAQSQSEVRFLIFDYLFSENLLAKGSPNGAFVITPAGWKHIQSRPELQGKTAFIAMCFDPSLDHIWTGPISAAVREAGYHPVRVYRIEHNDDITDEIMAGIRLARFVIADFSFHRAGVYYEAGFAFGLGKPVIKMVRESDKNNLHFDTRQLNHIIWKEDDLPKLQQALKNRIIATVGPGPLSDLA